MSAWEQVRPAYFTLPFLPPDRRSPGDWLADAPRAWGAIRLRLVVAPDSSLHVGSGAPRPAGGVLVAAQASVPRRRGSALVEEPVVPGSSLKGAVRVVVEALTPSCDPLASAACKAASVCPACLIFGTAGRRGLVSFTDAAVPSDAELPPLSRREVAQRYSHQHAPRGGRRLYGPEPESPLPRLTEVLEVLPGQTVLVATLFFDGVPQWGMGVIAIALGLGDRGLPHLRLGAGKNRSMGIVHCEIDGGWYAENLAAAVRTGGRRPANQEAIGRWEQSAIACFGELRERRDMIQRAYEG